MSSNQLCAVLMFGFYHLFQTIGTKPVAHIDQFTADMLGSAELAEEVNLDGSGKLLKVSLTVKLLLDKSFCYFKSSYTDT